LADEKQIGLDEVVNVQASAGKGISGILEAVLLKWGVQTLWV
jgi:hypothetical protein